MITNQCAKFQTAIFNAFLLKNSPKQRYFHSICPTDSVTADNNLVVTVKIPFCCTLLTKCFTYRQKSELDDTLNLVFIYEFTLIVKEISF